jgi:hypothetical protein
MRLRLRSSKQLKPGLAALAVVALLLPGLRASAQTQQSTDEFGEDAKPAKPAKSAEAEVPAEATESTPPPPPLAMEPATDTNPFVPFAPPPAPLRVDNSNASIQLGILAQPQFEMAGAPDATLTTKNLWTRWRERGRTHRV